MGKTDCVLGVCESPPPLGSPRFARGTEKRAHLVPPACRGNLKEGVHKRSAKTP